MANLYQEDHSSYIQGSLDHEYRRKIFEPKKGCEGLGKVEVSLPDIFLIESYGEDLPEILDFFFHLICFYGEDMPAIYLLTEKGYRPVSGFGFNSEKRIVSLHVSNSSKRNRVSYPDRYEVSRLGINKV